MLLAALTTTLLALLRSDATGVGFVAGYAVAWVLFAAAVVAVRRVPARMVVPLVLAGAVAVTATGLVAPPRTSTDAYRYAWDGRVQAAGVSPYDHAPADPALAGLRDPWLFPDRATCAHGSHDLAALGDGLCTRINRPAVHTIYPPVAEGWFLLVHSLSPTGVRHKALQTGAAVLSLSVTALLVLVLRRRGDPRRAAWWAWCPAVPVEGVNNAHADVLAVLFAVCALVAVTRRRAAGGFLLGLAITAKLLPALLVSGALSGVRRPRQALAVLGAAAGTIAALYLPYVLLSRGSVLGYLGGYAEEEGYDDAGAGSRYALVRLVVPDVWAMPAVLLGLAVVSVLVVVRGDPERPWRGALVTTGTAFLLLTPGYSWYALLLVALVALDGRGEWLGVALAGAVAYLAGPELGSGAATAAYGTAAVAAYGGWWLRRRGRRERAARRPRRRPDGGERAEVGRGRGQTRVSAAAPKETSKRSHQMLTLVYAPRSVPAGRA
ncbi:glycosyltransferase 87 family protein [Streptomyces roseicoloratus]|uniref:Glycosyltransferase 87 family protein n=1 Tax=Streptomyces roseicoloratus TaxID=2508722 RepID=A0ABY9RP20_9ACTN|nr:glycosyltransferase 87 family protein [Streptomyces roseicoloratus]WMX43637.1 glycosyltransferase 87 family protein [Streptomyces roseicoloratus]